MLSRKKILFAEPEGVFHDAIMEQLNSCDDFEAFSVSQGTQTSKVVQVENYDLIILSNTLPDVDVTELCRKIRQIKGLSPMIIIMGSVGDNSSEFALGAGFDDYIEKPFRLNHFLSKLRTLIRKKELGGQRIFKIGPYEFCPTLQILLSSDRKKETQLTEKETAILQYLFNANGAIIGRGELLYNVWGYSSGVTTHTLETHVYKLRQKIEVDPSNAQILKSELGGYCLVP